MGYCYHDLRPLFVLLLSYFLKMLNLFLMLKLYLLIALILLTYQWREAAGESGCCSGDWSVQGWVCDWPGH